MTELGDQAPDFTTRNQHGETVVFSELVASSAESGGRVLLVFYPWAFSSICTGELASLREASAQLAEAGVRVVACSCDSMFSLRAFADAEHLPFDLLADHWPHGAIATAYGVFDPDAGCALRGSFLIDGSGAVTWSTLNGIGEPRDVLDHLTAASA